MLDSLTFMQLLSCHMYMGRKVLACLYESPLTSHLLVKQVSLHCTDSDFSASHNFVHTTFCCTVQYMQQQKSAVIPGQIFATTLPQFFHFKIVNDKELIENRLQTHSLRQAHFNSTSRKNNGLKISHQKEFHCKAD